MKRNLLFGGDKRAWRTCLLLAFAGLLCLSGRNVYADMYMESKSTQFAMGRQTGEAKLEKTYVTADKMKTVQGDGMITIIRLDKGLMWDIDGAGKTYREMPLKGMIKAAQQAMEAVKDAMASMSPEQRKQMEQYMPQLGNAEAEKPKVDMEMTGEKKKVSGYKCELIVGTTKTTRTKVWATKQIKYDKDAKKFFKAWSDIFSSVPVYQEESYIDKNLMDSGLFPVETISTSTIDPRGFSTTSIVTKVEHKKINNSEFELPPGLKKLSADFPH